MDLNIDRSNWTKVRLGEVVEWYQKDIPNELQSEQKIEYYITASEIDGDEVNITRYKELSDGQKGPTITKHFEKGDLLLSTRSVALRKAAIAPVSGVTGEKLLVLRCAEGGRLNPKLMPFVLQSAHFWHYAQNSASGSVNKFTSWTKLAKYEFLLPPKDQQAELSKLLWAMDDVIEREREVLEKLKKSYQVEIEKSVPRQYNDHWKLEELIKTRKGVTYKSKDYSDKENGIPLLNLKSIEKGGGFNTYGMKYYNGDYKETHFVKNDDLIIACTDITRDGNVVGYPLHPSTYQNKRMLFTMDLVAIEISNNNLLRDYLYYALKSSWVHWILFAHSPGTTVLHLDLQGMKKIRIPKFSLDKQEEVISKLRGFEHSIGNTESKISGSQSLQKSLINQIF